MVSNHPLEFFKLPLIHLSYRCLEEDKRVELLQPTKVIAGFKPGKHATCGLPKLVRVDGFEPPISSPQTR